MKGFADGRRLFRLVLIVAACALLPSTALANGAMSLALATFAWTPWLVYVIVTILLEAIALGKWLRVPAAQAIKNSLKANLFTAVLGGFFSGILCALFGFYGGRLNPNPFGQTLFLFTVFGSLSALIEAYAWMRATESQSESNTLPPGSASLRRSDVIMRCLIVHLIGVPVGLAVLLVPSHPYPGLQGQVYAARVIYLEQHELKKALTEYISEHQSIPPVGSYAELLQLLRPQLGRFANDPDLWAAAYLPDYSRFDTTDKQQQPIEWNKEVAAAKINYDTESAIWLIRSRYDGFAEGLVLTNVIIRRTTSLEELGYSKPINHGSNKANSRK